MIDTNKYLLKSPSAEGQHTSRSSKYSFLPTTSVIDKFKDAGWDLWNQQEARVRDLNRHGFQKHLLTFRKDFAKAEVEEYVVQAIVENSHDGTSSFKLFAGVYVKKCHNGLIVADKTFISISIRHVRIDKVNISRLMSKFVEDTTFVHQDINRMQMKLMNDDECATYLTNARKLRWDDDSVPLHILEKNCRTGETTRNLWGLFNIVQENMLKGKVYRRIPSFLNSYEDTIRKVRPVDGIDQKVSLNRKLWDLTLSYL